MLQGSSENWSNGNGSVVRILERSRDPMVWTNGGVFILVDDSRRCHGYAEEAR